MRQLKISKSITNRESESLEKYLQEIGREDLITAEEEVKLKGGNSNWRGPLWFPTNYLLIEALAKLETAHPHMKELQGVARDIAERMIAIFRRDAKTGKRPVFGGQEKFQNDPNWRDNILFYEHFHGDEGCGI